MITMAGSELLVETAAMLGLLPSLPSTFSLPNPTTASSTTFSLLPTITSYPDLVNFGGEKSEVGFGIFLV